MPVKLDLHNVRKAEEVFKGYLRQRDLKFTPERQTILQAILRNDEHFEAEEQRNEVVARSEHHRSQSRNDQEHVELFAILISLHLIKQSGTTTP